MFVVEIVFVINYVWGLKYNFTKDAPTFSTIFITLHDFPN